MNAIHKVFDSLKKNNRKALITYSVAGDPDLDSSEKIIRNFIHSGVDIIEVGVPFSDPMAEGPSIQLGHERALKNNISLKDIFLTLIFNKDSATFIISREASTGKGEKPLFKSSSDAKPVPQPRSSTFP